MFLGRLFLKENKSMMKDLKKKWECMSLRELKRVKINFIMPKRKEKTKDGNGDREEMGGRGGYVEFFLWIFFYGRMVIEWLIVE